MHGAVTQFGVTVRAIADDGTATLSDGREVSARAIIGADGPRSLVGRRIGSPNKELVETRQLTAPLQTAPRRDGHLICQLAFRVATAGCFRNAMSPTWGSA